MLVESTKSFGPGAGKHWLPEVYSLALLV